ncbi:unnamed protein product [Phyllotreta striolata]|uniref:Uncharacterized protein n=1 Tax=Phyllotreta striolata TaxID=444603 RepID=A0A9N9TV66_PHYSR|nr:unnamed protein product [Phyllotreta striolata]
MVSEYPIRNSDEKLPGKDTTFIKDEIKQIVDHSHTIRDDLDGKGKQTGDPDVPLQRRAIKSIFKEMRKSNAENSSPRTRIAIFDVVITDTTFGRKNVNKQSEDPAGFSFTASFRAYFDILTDFHPAKHFPGKFRLIRKSREPERQHATQRRARDEKERPENEFWKKEKSINPIEIHLQFKC